MAQYFATVLEKLTVHAAIKQVAFKQVWQDFQLGISGRHEGGCFILQDPNGQLSVMRWPTGVQGSIPSHRNRVAARSTLVPGSALATPLNLLLIVSHC